MRAMAGHLALTHATASIDVTVWVPVAGAAPMRRIARRAIVRARMITRSAVVAAVAVEQAAVSAGAAVMDISAAAHRLIGPDHRPLSLARLATRFTASVTTPRTVIRINRSATGAADERQREHDKRAFHLSPPSGPRYASRP